MSSILVAYGSRYGATQGIAERIAQKLRAAGHIVDLQAVETTRAVDGYDAFVIGSAAYMGFWKRHIRGTPAGRRLLPESDIRDWRVCLTVVAMTQITDQSWLAGYSVRHDR